MYNVTKKVTGCRDLQKLKRQSTCRQTSTEIQAIGVGHNIAPLKRITQYIV